MTPPLLPAIVRRPLCLISFLFIIACLGACTYRPRILETQPPVSERTGQKRITGLKTSLDEAARNGGALRVFLVHGMSNHPYGKKDTFQERFGEEAADYPSLLESMKNPQWLDKKKPCFIQAIKEAQFDPLIPEMIRQLGFSACDEEQNPPLEWFRNGNEIIGYLLVRTFTASDAATGKKKQLVLYIHSWAHSCLKPKSDLLKQDTYNHRDFTPLNREIKNGLVTWGLMDAAMYVGGNRSNMQYAVAQGIASMAGDSDRFALEGGGHVPDRFAFISASLGSIICLDTLARVSDEGRRCFGEKCVVLSPNVVTAMFRDDVPLYMLANQIPLLGAAAPTEKQRQRQTPVSDSQTLALQSFAKALSDNVSRQPAREPLYLNVVAFTDPADLLSYPISGEHNERNVNLNVVNVLTRNQAVGVWYTLSDPMAAHGDFPKTKAVINFILDGEPKKL